MLLQCNVILVNFTSFSTKTRFLINKAMQLLSFKNNCQTMNTNGQPHTSRLCVSLWLEGAKPKQTRLTKSIYFNFAYCFKHKKTLISSFISEEHCINTSVSFHNRKCTKRPHTFYITALWQTTSEIYQYCLVFSHSKNNLSQL